MALSVFINSTESKCYSQSQTYEPRYNNSAVIATLDNHDVKGVRSYTVIHLYSL